MEICTFFGHRNAPSTVKPALRQAIIDLIITNKVDYFMVGHNGHFDRMVLTILRELSKEYNIQYAVVVESLQRHELESWQETLFPDKLETVPPKFAIWHRNKWMLEQANYVITYITHTFGGAAQFAEMARKKKKVLIELKDQTI